MRIGVLGALQIQDGNGRAVRIGGHRLRALLIMLALDADRVVSVHSLIDRLWPGDQPADAANALQSLVSRLRATLRDAGIGDGLIESSPAGYRLAIPADAVDAVAFEARARAGGRALAEGDALTAARVLREALSAWRGPALADVAGEEFAAAPAARLEELRSTAALDAIEADLALGAAGGGLAGELTGELRAMTAADPLAERPRALLMRALAATGRQADALAVYTQGRELLADRLGVDPSPRLEQVYLAVLRGEIPQAPPAVPLAPADTGPASLQKIPQARPAVPQRPADSGTASSNQEVPLARPAVAVPPAGSGAASPYPERTGPAPAAPARLVGGQRPPTSFIGRDDDVSGVLKKLAEERLVTLTGPGGVGKTRLAAEAAGRLGTTAWFAGLAPVTEPSQVPSAVLDALGLSERVIGRHGAEGAGDPVGKLCDALDGRDVVLVLDNCEHVIEAAARLAERLLADCARVRILATSTEPLRIGGEILWVVPPLAVPPAPLAVTATRVIPQPPAAVPDVAEIYPYPAVQLFSDRAAAVQPAFVLDESNAAAVARICRALDGLPLAIELAAVWLRTLTPAQLAERLDRRFALLTGGSRTALPRHQTLRAVVEWSWNLLSGAERVLARRLALFPGGATLAATEQVCAGEGLDRADVLPALSGLVGKSILAVVDGPGDSGPRYRMLETVRAYALEQLADAGEDSQVRDAYAGYYLSIAQTADPLLRTGAQVRWFRELMAEQDNLHAALRWAIAKGDADVALRFVRALSYFWVQRGHGEGDTLARETLALEPPPLTTLPVVEARVICALLAAGWSWDIETIRAQLSGAIALLNQWSAQYESYHPIAAMAEPLLAQYDGDQEKALTIFERYAAATDPWLRAMGRLYRASYAGALGRLDGTEEDCHAALALFRELGETWGTAITLTQIAEFVELRADHSAAIAALEEAVAIGRQLGAWGDMSYIEGKLAIIHARTGEVARAQADLDRVVRDAVERGANSDTERWTAFMRAELAWRAGDLAGVTRSCEALLTTIGGLRAGWWQSLRAHLKTRLAMVALAQDDLPRCRDLLGEALRAVTSWVEHPTLGLVIDAIAAYVLRRDADAGAELAATLLGAAHAVRGAFDESSLDAPSARAAARAALGEPAFETAYASGRALGYETAVSTATTALAGD